MRKTKKLNQGFSLIELLIAVTILSIVMIMVVQFMSTSSAAYRKTKKNQAVQTEAMKVVEQLSDTLMQAQYVRVVTKDDGMYSITKTDTDTKNKRVITKVDTPDKTKVSYDFVPDNYCNYAEKRNSKQESRKVIVDFKNYRIVDETNNEYPLTTDLDYNGVSVRSFRALSHGGTYSYVKPEYIYVEYMGKDKLMHVIYHLTNMTDDTDDTCSLYMYRYESNLTDNTKGFEYARTQLNAILGVGAGSKQSADDKKFTSAKHIGGSTKKQGLVSDKVEDFYLSADVEGNAILANLMFKDGGYQYNAVETISIRNSQVLTVRPQKLFKVKQTVGTP